MSADASVNTDVWELLQNGGGTSGLSQAEVRALAARLVSLADQDKHSLSEVWALGAMHPDAELRLALVAEAAASDDDGARELLAWAVKDVDDRVAITALQAINDPESMEEVFDAAGRSLAALDGVCHGSSDLRHSSAVRAAASLIARHPDAKAERLRLSWLGYEQQQSLRDRTSDSEGMVEVSAGGRIRFPFLIDRFPVTCRQYEQFVSAVAEGGPIWSHPGQPAGHDHDVMRGWDDDRRLLLADHPVTGVTWYDAWAFAAWAGKRLPTVAQWERAAHAADHPYPWGAQAPTAEHANFALAPLDSGSHDLFRWPRTPLTHPVDAHPAGAAESGVHDLLGNVWEWTRSRYLDEEEINPFVGALSYGETISDWTLSACIKGGSWSTDIADLSSALRAAKHVLQRGPETGFRCVIEPQGE